MSLDPLHRYRSTARNAFQPAGSDVLDRVAFLMLLVLLIAEPLLYGAILPLPFDGGAPAPFGSPLLTVFAFLTAAAALLSRSALLQVRPLRTPLVAAGCLTLLGVAQLLPLPEGVLQKIASVNLQIYHETAQILTLFGFRRVPAPRISIAPGETILALLGWLSCVALFLSAASLLGSRARRRVFGWTVVLSAGLHLLRLAAFRTGVAPGWARSGAGPAAAGCVAVALLVAFGMVWTEVLTGPERASDSPDAADRFERRFAPVAGRVIVWLALAVGLVWIRQPAPIAAAAASTLALLALASNRRRQDISRRLANSAAALLFLGLFLAARAGASPGDPGPIPAANTPLRATSIAAWRQFPVLGSGLGTFREAFRRVQPRDMQGLVDEAPSVPLDLLVTGGVAGAAFGAILVLSLLFVLVRNWRLQKHREESAVALAAFGALLFWTLAGLLDGSACPASVSALLAPVLGAGWAASQARGARIL